MASLGGLFSVMRLEETGESGDPEIGSSNTKSRPGSGAMMIIGQNVADVVI